MVYVKEQNSIKKYNVEVDKEKLNELRNIIILNCSYLTHFERKVKEENLPNEDDYLTYRNFDKEHIGTHDETGFFSSGWTNIYKITYDEAKYPEIIKLIDEVLNGKYDNVLELLEYKEVRQREENNKFDLSITNLEDAKQAKEKVDEIIKKIYNQKLNEKRVSVGNYMDEVRLAIKLILVEELDISDFNKVYNFVDQDIKEKIDKKIKVNSYKIN